MKDSEIESVDLSGWPLPDAFLVELGRVVALWNVLEGLLNVAISKLLGFNEGEYYKGFITLTHASFPQKLDMLGSLCEQLLPGYPGLADYKDVVAALRAAQTERNRFAHSGISEATVPGEFVMAVGSARGSIKAVVKKVTLADIRRATIRIDEAQAALYGLVFERKLEPQFQVRRAGTRPS